MSVYHQPPTKRTIKHITAITQLHLHCISLETENTLSNHNREWGQRAYMSTMEQLQNLCMTAPYIVQITSDKYIQEKYAKQNSNFPQGSFM